MSEPLRILYAAGPGDVIGTYLHWKQGRDDPSQVAITYSGQFYSACRELGAQGYVISQFSHVDYLTDGSFIIEHRPVPFEKRSGPLYHVGQIWYGVLLTFCAIRFGADVAVVAAGTHWFSLWLLPTFGVRVVPTLHCVLWPKGHPPKGIVGRFIRAMNGAFFRKRTAGVLSLSKDISGQLTELLHGAPKPIISFLPTYRTGAFRDSPALPSAPPFRVFFAGRIERNKGVFDLLEIARRFAKEGRTDIEFDLAGNGMSLEGLRAAAEVCGLQAMFRCHGHCEKDQMRELYAACHVVIAPTTNTFIEGFNKVVAEGVLAGKPVISSSACPAVGYVGEAVAEVPVNDIQAYGDMILRLCDDAAYYDGKHRQCLRVQSQFYDATLGWGAALKKMLTVLFGTRAPQPHRAPAERPVAQPITR